jgi:hypothetical protein
MMRTRDKPLADGARFLQGTGGTRELVAGGAGGDLKESYILGRSAPSQRSALAETGAGGVDAQWPQSTMSDDGSSGFDGAKFRSVLLSYHAVGLCKLKPVDPQLESAWFQPLLSL